jgi:signal transduction histidine kinase
VLAALYRSPAGVCAAVLGADLAVWSLRPSWTLTGALVLPLVSYAATSSRGRAAGAAVLVVAGAGLVGATVVKAPVYLADGSWMPALLLCAMGVLAGDAVHARRRWQAHERVAAQRAAALEERLRLSRDLHDVVAHHLTAIVVQADTAPQRLPRLPDEAARSFTALGGAARAALAETRQLISYLRADAGRADSEHFADGPGLDQLADLLAAAARDGLTVDLRTVGARGPVPPAVGLAAYRVVQEALTNARRHSQAVTARVEVGRDGDALTVRVADPGPVVPTGASAGFGLIGLRERVGSLGGRLQAGPRAGGGFEVLAWLPMSPPAAPARAAPVTSQQMRVGRS